MCGPFVLAARLRPSNIDEAAGALKVLQGIIAQVRQAWPKNRITIRGDGGFCRDPIMTCCDGNNVDYIIGLPKNKRLLRMIGAQMHEAQMAHQATGKAARVFSNLEYRTLKSWSRLRRVVAKAEHIDGKANPRFVVTSLAADKAPAKELYERDYCGRGNMENRIKEQQMCLFADRTSAATMRANQIRLYLSTIAYTMMLMTRTLALKGTALEQAMASTVREKILKIGARVSVSARKVWVSFSSAFPLQEIFAMAYDRLASLARWSGPVLATG